jgi:hypothetical protein
MTVDPQRISEAFPGLAAYFSKIPPLLILELVCLSLVLVDALYTGARCWTARPDAPDYPEFVMQRITMVMVMFLCGLLEPLVPTLPLLGAASIYYGLYCLRHILLGVAADGVPVPDVLLNVLRGSRTKEPS